MLNHPANGAIYDNRATISCDGMVSPPGATVYVQIRRVTTGVIYDSASGTAGDNGNMTGNFSGLDLDPPALTGWPVDKYVIELYVNGVEVNSSVIDIVSQ